MATYKLQGPDGKVYTLEGPEGASKEQLVQVLQSKLAGQLSTDPEPETESEGLFQEIGEGLLSGSSKAVQGLVETGTLLYDLASDDDITSDVSQRFDDFRASLGLDPVGLPGEIAEIITQFVVPGGLAVKAVGKGVKVADKVLSPKDVALLPAQIAVDPIGTVVKRTAALSPKLRGKDILGTKLGKQREAFRKGLSPQDLSKPQKFALGAATLGAVAGADVMVATDDVTTIGDFFEGGPTQTSREIGLSGREETLRRIGNKLKIGVETGGIVAATPPVLGAAGATLGFVGDKVAGVAAPIISPAARFVRESTIPKQVADYLADIEERRILNSLTEPLKNIKNPFTGEDIRIPILGGTLGEETLANFLSIFRSRGYLPEDVSLQRLLIAAEGEASIRNAKAVLADFQNNLVSVIEEQRKLDPNGVDTDLLKLQYFNNIEAALTATKTEDLNNALAELPKEIRSDVRKMANQLDSAQSAILNSDYFRNLTRVIGVDPQTGAVINAQTAEDLQKTIRRNLNGFLRRRFEIFENENYKPSDQVRAEAIDGFLLDDESLLEYLTKGYNAEAPGPETLRKFGLIEETLPDGSTGLALRTLVDEDALRARASLGTDQFLRFHQIKNREALSKRTEIARNRLNPALFLRKGGLPEYQRKLLGEFLDVDEAFLGTVADISEFKAVDAFYGRIRNQLDTNPGLKRLFHDTRIKVSPNASPEVEALEIKKARDKNLALTQQGFKVLDGEIIQSGADKGLLQNTVSPAVSSYGSLQGFAVPEAVFNYLSRPLKQDGITSALFAALNTGIRAKSTVQYSKTVLSPITQIRNVTSASLFALMQGNVGRGANLAESFDLVLKNFAASPEPEVLKELTELQRLGVLGSQAELREIQDLIRQGAGVKELESEIFVEGLKRVPSYSEKVNRSKFSRLVSATKKPIKSALKTAETAYAGGDDLWKIYNFKFEQQKLVNAFRGVSPEDVYQTIKGQPAPQGAIIDVNRLITEEAADIVRNTVPNYNMVPEVIKGLRKVPLIGNFISFPAEIIRTGTNTINRGIKELASKNPELQKTGLRRLTGAIFTAGVVPVALQNLAISLTGVAKEELEAYKKALGPSWQKEARLIPTGRDENGLPLFINYSFANPYELIESMGIAALNAYDEAEARGQDYTKAVSNAMLAPIAKFFEPFVGESIVYARFADAFLRDGETETGARVYAEEDSDGDKNYRRFLHIMDAFLPNFVPISTNLGEPQVKRFARSFINSTGLFDETVSEKDKIGVERQIVGELLRGITGLTEEAINVDRGLQFVGLEYKTADQSASSIFNRVGTDKNLANPDAIYDAFVSANEAKYRVDTRLKLILEELDKLGVSKRQIRSGLAKKVGSDNLSLIMRGKFQPFEISESIEGVMRENKTWPLVPKARIKAYVKAQRRVPLKQEDVQKDVTEETKPQAAAPSTPTTPVATTGINVPNVQPPTGPVSQTSPILIPDPTTRELAEQLEARRG